VTSPEPQEQAREEPQPVVVQQQPEPDNTPPRPAPEPAREPVSEQPAASTTGMWAVQLGSFSNKENAEKLAADLRKQGYAAFLSEVTTDSGQLHRVRIGPQKDRESAAAMAARLLKVGHKGQVVPHP
jgi:DedD protein